MARASLDAATMPPFASRRAMRTRASDCAASASTSATCGDGEQSSTRHSSQSSNVWAVTDAIVSRSTSAGGS